MPASSSARLVFMGVRKEEERKKNPASLVRCEDIISSLDFSLTPFSACAYARYRSCRSRRSRRSRHSRHSRHSRCCLWLLILVASFGLMAAACPQQPSCCSQEATAADSLHHLTPRIYLSSVTVLKGLETHKSLQWDVCVCVRDRKSKFLNRKMCSAKCDSTTGQESSLYNKCV